ncbi:MAG: zf-HC2 domain-containing protein [Myxococcota bacterium]|nr:zf-HC2 domain-containing protein [Myxococcota bacterium]
MNHSGIQDHMADYLEGHLPLEKRALFDAHLDGCSDCLAEIRSMQQTLTLLRSLPEPEVSLGFSESVMRRVHEAESRVSWMESLQGAFSLLMNPRVLAPVSVALIALGIIGGAGEVEKALVLEVPGGSLATQTLPTDGAVLAGISLPAHSQKLAAGRTSVPGASFQIRLQSGPVRVPEPPPHLINPIPLNEFSQYARGFRGGVVKDDVFYELTEGNLEARPQGARMVAVPSRVRAQEKQPSAEEWLARLKRNPGDFASALSSSTLAEQELWIANLARHARQRGELPEIITALRQSPNQRANLLAEDFEAASRGQDSSGHR